MFSVDKLAKLSSGQRRRKLIALLLKIEKALLNKEYDENAESYLRSLVILAIEDIKLDRNSVVELNKLLAVDLGLLDLHRVCNCARNALLTASGISSAEWDLVHPEDNQKGQITERFCFPGLMVYVEDIRSPFNLGSIFRTAEAFGAEKITISPLCVSPSHSRAQRSAMGSIDFLPWERVSLEQLPIDIPVFALETGGISLREFKFPEKGIVIVGSEELGVSPEGLERAMFGRVSIPMTGIKASLNVGVAFGILMEAWTSYLLCSDSKPF